uniref:Receptor ligand binding region domain-containing protein n=1 Tax=Chromera velia CCMP2878 TaxID=1169474 RepID=A0A0G4IG19_9ALVE|eukprot:Cvel_2498.t1-p1 / transcript=Cvel_2498.t1 / gene=Cvel_2498 / organism=Chromera_velia_CCMP2878 / gene_product=Gamma-aminobutyric acid type B receptor subunit 1, putative / transcript_product=Gamma-aminobutyric acid type B receptor subunit 1, putative / location=Cvel_scaffold98:53876-59548(+) / protein_length=488 / sequence_SO=supercontig / SO=protein_coding / is_pseudo=false
MDAVMPIVNISVAEVNNNGAVLPSDTIALNLIQDTGCDQYVAAGVAPHFVETDRPALVVGPACSSAATGANLVFTGFKIIHVSPSATSPTLSDSSTFKGLLRVFPVVEYMGLAGLMNSFNVGRYGIVSTDQDVALSTVAGLKAQFLSAVLLFEVQLAASSIAVGTDLFDSTIDLMRNSDVKVIVLAGYANFLLGLWCAAYKKGFYGNDIMFIYTNWVQANFMTTVPTLTDCTKEQVLLASSNAFGTYGPLFPVDSSAEASTQMSNGRTPAQVKTEYLAACGSSCHEALASLYYDAMWDSFYALHNFMNNAATWTANGLSSSDFGTSPDPKRTQLYDGLYAQFLSNSFTGITGALSHDANADREGRLTITWIDWHSGSGEVITAGIWDHISSTQRNASRTCELCPPGQMNSAEDGSCVECGIGTYSSAEGATECLACPAGTFAFGTEQLMHELCLLVRGAGLSGRLRSSFLESRLLGSASGVGGGSDFV